MRLLQLDIEHFRGIDHLSLELGRTVILLGENRVGKTSVVDALEYCLGASRSAQDCPFVPTDLPQGGDSSPIELTLTFEESRLGEWEEVGLEELCLAFLPGEGPLRRIRAQLTGRGVEQEMVHAWGFVDEVGRPLGEQVALEQIAALRRLMPCMYLAASRYYNNAPPPPDDPEPGETARLRRVVDDVYRSMCRTRGGLSVEEIQVGLRAVRRLEELRPEQLTGEEDEPRDVRDIVDSPQDLSSLPTLPGDENSLSAQNLALLLLVGGLLEARGGRALPHQASPLVVIEEPEAHLHPILAASLWGTLERLAAQKVITTNSGELLASAPLSAVRRLTRLGGLTTVHRLSRRSLTTEELRRVGYHVRLQRGGSLFARSWLLVEGETEAWLLPELARLCGYVLASEGVACLEFAQCGVEPMIKLAKALGIEWHVLADGDMAGESYLRMVKRHIGRTPLAERATRLPDLDVEHYLWESGYADVFRAAATLPTRGKAQESRKRRRRGEHLSDRVIRRAIKSQSKPFLALRVVEAAAEAGSPGVPRLLRQAVEIAVRLARTSSDGPGA
jgi:putative ATP-dependent endonuclease of the OLD family